VSGNTELVSAFCRAWSNRDVDEILGYFTEDAVYHNMPMPPMQGKPAIKTILQQIVSPTSWIEWETLNMAEAGKKVELPVAGVF
jgi:limonene-1,2-epoxide hydrolase